MTTPERAHALLDEVADDLVARGLPEGLVFAIAGRSTGRPVSSALHFLGFEHGRFVVWYRESSERSVLAESGDLAEVLPVFVRAVLVEERVFRVGARRQRDAGWPAGLAGPAGRRYGRWATLGAATFAVTGVRGGWSELDAEGRVVGPLLRRSDLDRLVAVSTSARLDGEVVGLEVVDGERARVGTLVARPDLVERWGLEGNPKDGWVGHVPVAALRQVVERREDRRVDHPTLPRPVVRDWHARVGGGWFPVRHVRRGVWQRWEPAGHGVRLVGPELRLGDVDAVALATTHGTVAGHRFALEPGPEEQLVVVRDHVVADAVVERLGLTGNPDDGWRGTVAWSEVTDVVETWAFQDPDRPDPGLR